jgi:hypothetical protein
MEPYVGWREPGRSFSPNSVGGVVEQFSEFLFTTEVGPLLHVTGNLWTRVLSEVDDDVEKVGRPVTAAAGERTASGISSSVRA